MFKIEIIYNTINELIMDAYKNSNTKLSIKEGKKQNFPKEFLKWHDENHELCVGIICGRMHNIFKE